MIGTLLRIGWINLKRDRVAQAVTFLLPVAFFSIFATIFGSQGRAGTQRVSVALVDEDRSEFSGRLVRALAREPGLRIRPAAPAQQSAQTPIDRARAQAMVRNGDVPIAIVIPAGTGDSFMKSASTAPRVLLLSDPSDAIAPQMVNGLLQKVAMTAAPDLMVSRGLGNFEKYAGALTPEQRKAVDSWLPTLQKEVSDGTPGAATADSPTGGFGLSVQIVDVLRETRGESLVAFYAAGTAVMFLLFMCAGAGGSLIEEVESGTLERLIGSRLKMTGLLAGKWLYLTLLGIAEILVMFTWGALVFGLPLLPHLAGFAVMTTVTAAAAAAFGLVLATLARTRAQLSGISTIIILTMSAVGGSMFPRFLMSDTMQKIGLMTFNAWALDGYIKVFWRNVPIVQLWPQVLVLTSLTIVFFSTARLLARRWETV